MDTEHKFSFGEKVIVEDTSLFSFSDCEGVIKGKIKDLDCYVVLFSTGIKKPEYGFPNRHLELEWGKFSGYDNECIVPSNKLKKSQ